MDDDDDDDDDDIVMRLPIPNLNYCEKDSLAYEGDKSVMRVEWRGYVCMHECKQTNLACYYYYYYWKQKRIAFIMFQCTPGCMGDIHSKGRIVGCSVCQSCIYESVFLHECFDSSTG